MEVVFFTTLKQMGFLFSMMLLGYFINKKNLVGEETDTIISKLLSNIVILAVAFQTFALNTSFNSLKERSSMFIWALVVTALAWLLSIFVSKLFTKDKYTQNLYSYSFTAPNATFMGVPVINAVFGEEMLFDYMICVLPIFIYAYTIGYIILNPNEKKISIKSFFNPIMVSVLLGMAVGIFNIKLPEIVNSGLSSVSGCMSPLAMILIGFVIAKYDIKDLFTKKRVYLAVLLRLIVIPVIFVAIMYLFRADSRTIMMVLATLALPTGLNMVIFPAANGKETKTGAALTLLSSLFSVITIPIMFALFIK